MPWHLLIIVLLYRLSLLMSALFGFAFRPRRDNHLIAVASYLTLLSALWDKVARRSRPVPLGCKASLVLSQPSQTASTHGGTGPSQLGSD
jgi:hypothetical protein